MATASKTEFGAWFANQQASGGNVSGAIAPAAPSTASTATSVATQGASAVASSAASAGAALMSSVGKALAGAASTIKGAATPTPSDIEAGSATPAKDSNTAAASTPSQSVLPPALGQAIGLARLAAAGYLGVPALAPSAEGGSDSPTATAEWTCGLSYAQRFQAFLLLGLGSLILYGAAVFVFLPMVILAPSKFASSFTFGSILWMAAFAMLRGPKTMALSLANKEKLPFTTSYIGSLLLTLYATMISQSYFLILLAVIIQMTAMVWYSASHIPGGTAAAGALGRLCFSSGRTLVSSLFR